MNIVNTDSYEKWQDIVLNESKKYDAVVLGVSHKEFANMDLGILKKENAIIYDVKGLLKEADGRL